MGRSVYQRRMKDVLKDIEGMWRAAGSLEAIVDNMFDEVFYMHMYYFHVVSPLLITHLISVKESVALYEGLRRRYKFVEVRQEDVESMEAVRDHLLSAVQLIDRERADVKAKLVVGKEIYSQHLYGKVFQAEHENFLIFEGCARDLGVEGCGERAGIAREIKELMDSEVGYEHAARLRALYPRYMSAVKSSRDVYYLGVKRSQQGNRVCHRKVVGGGRKILEMEVRAVLKTTGV